MVESLSTNGGQGLGSVLIGHKAVTGQTLKEAQFIEEPQNFQPNSLYKEGLGTKVAGFGH